MDDTAAALSSFVHSGPSPLVGLVGHPDMAPFTPAPTPSSLLSDGRNDNDIDGVVGSTPPVDDDDASDIAFAAEAAAEAVEANDAAMSQQQQLDAALQFQQHQPGPGTAPPTMANPAALTSMSAVMAVPSVTAATNGVVNGAGNNANLTCRICNQGESEGRPIIRFAPVDHNMNAAAAAPSVLTFSQDVQLHVFCGKTASILPNVNAPDLEILTKAGLKNKHGIGAEVNAALARTRCAILHQDGAKEKHYYLVREFEAHLAAIRHTHINFLSNGGSNGGTNGSKQPLQGNIVEPQRAPQQPQQQALPLAPQPDAFFHSQPQVQNLPQHQFQPSGVALPQAPPPLALQQQQQQQQEVQQFQHFIPNNPYDINQYQAAIANQVSAPNHLFPNFFQQQGLNNAMSNINDDGNHSSSNKQLPARAAAGKKKSKTARGGGNGGGKRRQQQQQQQQPNQPQQYQFQQQQGLLIPAPIAVAPPQLLVSQAVERRQGPPVSSPTPQQPHVEMTSDGKVVCQCGGKHWPPGTPRHASSWRSHLQTKRHKKWMEEQGVGGV